MAQTRLKSFGLDELVEAESIQVVLDGVLETKDFLLKNKVFIIKYIYVRFLIVF